MWLRWLESTLPREWHCIRNTKKDVDTRSDSLDRQAPRSVSILRSIVEMNFESLDPSIISGNEYISVKIF